MFDKSTTILMWPNSWKDAISILWVLLRFLISCIRLTIFDELKKIFGIGKCISPVDQIFGNILIISGHIIWYDTVQKAFFRGRETEIVNTNKIEKRSVELLHREYRGRNLAKVLPP